MGLRFELPYHSLVHCEVESGRSGRLIVGSSHVFLAKSTYRALAPEVARCLVHHVVSENHSVQKKSVIFFHASLVLGVAE